MDYVGALKELAVGPFAHGEDVRFMGPKKRGGLGGAGLSGGGFKPLTASGKLVGDEKRAWWPSEPVKKQIRPKEGGTRLENAAPFAIGRGMDEYDRRTFNPKSSRQEWDEAHRELRSNPPTTGEMERTLKQGLTQLASRLQANAQTAASAAAQAKAKAKASQASTGQLSPAVPALDVGAAAQRARPGSAGSADTVWDAEHFLRSTGRVSAWLSGGGAHTARGAGAAETRAAEAETHTHVSARRRRARLPLDYNKVVRGMWMGDAARQAMRGHANVLEFHRMLDNRDTPRAAPPPRPHDTIKARYFAIAGQGEERILTKRAPIIPHKTDAAALARLRADAAAQPDPWRAFGAEQAALLKRCAAENRRMDEARVGLCAGAGDARLRDRETILAQRIWGELRGRRAHAPSSMDLAVRVRPGFEETWLAETRRAAEPGAAGTRTFVKAQRQAAGQRIAEIMIERTPGLQPGNILLKQQNVKMQPYY